MCMISIRMKLKHFPRSADTCATLYSACVSMRIERAHTCANVSQLNRKWSPNEDENTLMQWRTVIQRNVEVHQTPAVTKQATGRVSTWLKYWFWTMAVNTLSATAAHSFQASKIPMRTCKPSVQCMYGDHCVAPRHTTRWPNVQVSTPYSSVTNMQIQEKSQDTCK